MARWHLNLYVPQKFKSYSYFANTHFGIQMRMKDIRERATQIKWQTLAKYLTIVDWSRT